MSIILKSFSVVLATIIFTSFFQNNDQLIQGKWVLKYVGEYPIDDCPDFLNFDGNHRYQIINDCSGRNMQDRIISDGKWEIDSKRMVLIFSSMDDRRYESWCDLETDEEQLLYTIKTLQEKIMVLRYETEKGKWTEDRYEKVN